MVLGQQEKELSQSVPQLQQKIEELEETIKAQQQTIQQAKKAYECVKKQLDEQIQENERLKILCEKAGIITTELKKTTFEAGDIVYRGEKRTQKWFDRMYEKCHDKIAFVDCKYVDIGEGILNLRGIWTGSPTSEKCRMGVAPYPSKVLSVLGNGEVLIHYEHENILHIRGVEHNFVDDEPWPEDTPLIRTGTFNYTAANGQHKTVWRFTVYKPLTKEQFADAITSGFKLISYKKMGEKIVERPIR